MDPIRIEWPKCAWANFGSGGETYSKGFVLCPAGHGWRQTSTDEIAIIPINGHGKVSHSIEMVFPKSAIPELIAALTMIGLMDG